MREEIMAILKCPCCHGLNLSLIPEERAGEDIRTGNLNCLDCHQNFFIKDGILNMLANESKIVARERKGNLEMVRQERAHLGEDWLLRLPHSYGEIYPDKTAHDEWVENTSLVAKMQIPRGGTVLELGAGTCWTTNFIATQGYRAIALDISAEMLVGLASGQVFMDKWGTYFERVLADMSNPLPFRSETVDAVVAFGAIHHAPEIRNTVQEVYRVLKPGGKLGLVEVTRSAFVREDEEDFGSREKEVFGWNEHKYSYLEYRHLLTSAGFLFQLLAAPSFFIKLDLLARGGELPYSKLRFKHRMGKILARSVWRFPFVKKITELVYPRLSFLVGTQVLIIAEKKGGRS